MRPRIVGAIMLLFVGLLGGIVLLSKMFNPQAATSVAVSGKALPAAIKAATPPATNPQSLDSEAPVTPVKPVASVTPVAEAKPSLHEQYVREQIKNLEALAWKNDIASRDAILAVLRSDPDKEVRAAAVEAAIQFSDRSVVPPMKEIAAQTVDPTEKAAILAAIDYINLPSLTEYRKANPKKASGTVPKLDPSINPQRQSQRPPRRPLQSTQKSAPQSPPKNAPLSTP